MNEGLVPPCSELGQSPEHTLLYWMSTHVNARGVVRDFDDRTKVFALRHLIDGGYIEKLTFEDSYRFKLLIRCPGQESFFEKVSPRASSASPQDTNLSRSDGLGAGADESARFHRADEVTGMSITELETTDSEWHPSAKKRERRQDPEVLLARDVFPDLARLNKRDRRLHEVGPLVGQLRLWEKKYGYDWAFVRLLMEEFGKHPEWYRGRPAWEVFVTRRRVLAALVVHRQKRDPSNRRWGTNRGREYWVGSRPTPRAVSPA